MKRRLELLIGVLLASALALGGCVASVQGDDDDDATDEGNGTARSSLVGAPAAGDPAQSTSGTDTGDGDSLVKPAAPGMSDPQPQPWKPPPSGPPADPGTPGQQR